MSNPVLFAVDEDERSLHAIERELIDRYARSYRVVCVASAAEAMAELEALAAAEEDVALVLAAPDLGEATGSELLGRVRDLHAHSEGFRTLVVDNGGIGGQATSSSLIRNYLGFPRGVSGRRLAESAYEQAWVFGAKFAFMHDATAIRREDDRLHVALSDGGEVSAHAVILATGATYRRLDVPELEALVGAGSSTAVPPPRRPRRSMRRCTSSAARTRPARRRCTWPNMPAG